MYVHLVHIYYGTNLSQPLLEDPALVTARGSDCPDLLFDTLYSVQRSPLLCCLVYPHCTVFQPSLNPGGVYFVWSCSTALFFVV